MKTKSPPLPLQLLLFVPCLLFLLANGCEPSPPRDPEITPIAVKDASGIEVNRFSVSHVGSFNAGYSDAKRDMLLIHDHQTGDEYLAVTDCSLVKVIQAEAAADAAEIAVEAATAIIENQ